jgi:uncharacterized membrane protein YoaK (UPF0700 family)
VSDPARAVHAQEQIAALLAMVAGYVDAYGYLTYNTFVSFMSGNTTQAGLRTGAGHPAALPMLFAIPFFIVGVTVGTLIVHSRTRQSQCVVLVLVTVVLAIVIAVTELRGVASALPIAMLTFAMGILNTSLSRVGAESVSLTFVTGTLSKIGHHLALGYAREPLKDAQGSWDTHRRRVLLLTGLWAAFFSGAALAGAATPRFASWTLVVPTVVLLALSASAGRQRSAIQ